MADAQHAVTYERLKAKLKAQLVNLADAGVPHRHGLRADRNSIELEMRQALQLSLIELRVTNLTAQDQEQLVRDVIDEAVGFGPLDRLLADPTISEIMVNGPREIFVERRGCLERIEETFHDTHHLLAVIERLLDSTGRSISESDPVCDASLPDGSRVNIIIPPLVLNGPVVTIRRKLRDWTMGDFMAMGAINPQAAEFLEGCVKAKANIIISGGTSTGKTTIVSILSSYIPPHERVITIENAAELELLNRQHWIRLVAKPPNIDGRGEVPLRTLVRNALRMRPDRVILGEARGGEALDVVQGMHMGHDGAMTVLHANSPVAALERLLTLMLMSGVDLPSVACQMQIVNAVDLVIHMARYADGGRRVSSISQVVGGSHNAFQLEDLFLFEVEGFQADGTLNGALRYTGVRPRCLSKFQLNNVGVPGWVNV
jgi:pilus assembly protein CpaF